MARAGGATLRLFLAGDVMLARGVDMIQAHSCDPRLYERNGMDAHGYVRLAEMENGPIPEKKHRSKTYIWGDGIRVLDDKHPDVRIINLETAVTTSSTPCPGKGIHYRMHPKNVDILQAAKIDCCSLANNHVSDWGKEGLHETLATLKSAGIGFAGAGSTLDEASRPATFDLGANRGRVLVFAAGHYSSGIPPDWRATDNGAGVNVLELERPRAALERLRNAVAKYKTGPKDVVVLSVHWGGNWGYDIEPEFREFAKKAVDEGGVDVIHGHSSHHPRGVEVRGGKAILYGCGDLINDYEGITGQGTDHYRGELSLMYFLDFDSETGKLRELRMVPTRMRRLRLELAPEKDVEWMRATMSDQCQKLGCKVVREGAEVKLEF